MIKSVVKWRDKPLQSFKDLCRQNFIRFHMVWHEFSEKLFFWQSGGGIQLGELERNANVAVWI